MIWIKKGLKICIIYSFFYFIYLHTCTHAHISINHATALQIYIYQIQDKSWRKWNTEFLCFFWIWEYEKIYRNNKNTRFLFQDNLNDLTDFERNGYILKKIYSLSLKFIIFYAIPVEDKCFSVSFSLTHFIDIALISCAIVRNTFEYLFNDKDNFSLRKNLGDTMLVYIWLLLRCRCIYWDAYVNKRWAA